MQTVRATRKSDEDTLLALAFERAGTFLQFGTTTVGAKTGYGLTLDDESVSRMHARLDREGERLFVTDLKSSNGTHVNGERFSDEARWLSDGDPIVIGGLAVAVVLLPLFVVI